MRGVSVLALAILSLIAGGCTSDETAVSPSTTSAETPTTQSIGTTPTALTTSTTTGDIPAPDTDGSYPELADALVSARQAWARNEPTAYRLYVKGHVGLLGIDTEVVVRDGEITVERGGRRAKARTVESLFDLVAEAIDRSEDTLVARFHPELGYPTSLSSLGSTTTPMEDDEWGLVVSIESIGD